MEHRSLRAIAIATALLTPTALLAQRPTFPNSTKYKDSSIANATGRSGSASIEARALFNRDNTTDLELTTASFDSTDVAASGSIAKVQLQFPTSPTRNLDGSNAGTFATNLTGLAPHAPLGVTTSVRDVDGARTDIVSVNEIVKRRPDVQLANLSAPATGIRGRNVIVRATLRELNGDTGARTDVRLYANGVLVDRAQYTWIDANGTVDCLFAPTIDMTGDVTLRAVADQTNPGDWDYANNAATAHVTMQDQVGEFYSWSANVYQEDFTFFRHEQYSWGDFTDDQKGTNQSFSFTGYIRAEPTLSDMKLTTSASSDGAELFDGEAVSFWPTFRNRFGYCARSETFSPDVSVCYDNQRAYMTVTVTYGAADVVYHSYGWATQENPWAPPEPRYEWNRTTEEHSMKGRFGSNVAMQVDFETSGKKWSASPLIPVGDPEVTQIDRPYNCYYDGFLNQNVCSELHSWRATRRGSADGFSE
jgi:hypothetical protein